jgi:hypothetical protein
VLPALLITNGRLSITRHLFSFCSCALYFNDRQANLKEETAMKKSLKNSVRHTRHLIASGVTLVATLVFLNGCAAHTSHRHHHDAGISGVNTYYYYPRSHVYYDSQKHRYHYHHASRGWVSVKKLPRYIHLDRHRYHVVQTGHQKPWKSGHTYKKHRGRYDDQDAHKRH